MRIRSCFLLMAAGIGFALGTAQSSHGAHRLRVGTLQLDAKTKLVLLGIKLHQGHPIQGFNFEKLGFEGKDLNYIDPKFLFEVTPEGITQVRSFDLGISDHLAIKADDTIAELPPVLINLSDAKKDQNLHAAGITAAAAGKTLPILGLPVAIGQIWSKYYENTRKLQAFYLMEIIDKALPDYRKFPELVEALSFNPQNTKDAETFLESLGGALLIRYNPQSNLRGLTFSKMDPAASYSRWRLLQMAKRSENRSYLNDQANALELDAVYMGEDFGLILVDAKKAKYLPKQKHYSSEFFGLGSAKKGPGDIVKSTSKVLDSKHGYLIPWYAVSFVNPDGPLDLGNFRYPGKFGVKLKKLAQWQLAREIIGTATGLYWPIKWINSFYDEAKLEKYDTKYLKRLQSYGAVLALSETHAYESLTKVGVNLDLIKEALRSLNLELDMSNKTQPEILNEAIALLTAEEEKMGRLLSSPTRKEISRAKNGFLIRLRNHIRQNQDLSEKPKVSQFKNTRINRSPCAAKPTVAPGPRQDRKPVILFLVDGLRPDRFKLAAKQGLMPNLKKLFLDSGTKANSFVSRSLTFPSWSTILTGVEPDMHGIRSNTATSRIKHRVTDNYQDARPDLLNIKNWVKTRAFQRLEEDKAGVEGKVWFPAYFDRDEAIYNFMPAVNNANSAAEGVIEDFLKNSDQYFSGIRFLASALDESSAKNTAKLIKDAAEKKTPLKFIMNWYAVIDEGSHYNNQFLPTLYAEVDKNVGLVLDAVREAAKTQPELEDATVFLLSDHGHTGGYGPFDATSTIYQTNLDYKEVTDGPMLAHTGLNLTKLLAGKLNPHLLMSNREAGEELYHFVVGAADSPAPKFELRVLEEFMLQPFHYNYPRHSGPPNALVDCSGDNMAQVYIKGDSQWNRLNYYALSHFQSKQDSRHTINLPNDLLSLQLETPVITDQGLLDQIKKLTGGHPVELFAMPLRDKAAKDSIDQLIGPFEFNYEALLGKKDFIQREPVLVIGRGNTGTLLTSLIQTRSDSLGHDEFRYIVMRNFSQEKSGKINATISIDPNDDPLHYINQVKGSEAFTQWRTDRDWLALAQDHTKPTAIFAIPRFVTLAPKYTDSKLGILNDATREARLGEIPDFVVMANPGYAFHSDAPLQSDHGGIAREEVLNTFFVSSLNSKKFPSHREVEKPVLSRDFMPTILEFAGINSVDRAAESAQISKSIQGTSFKADIDEANQAISVY